MSSHDPPGALDDLVRARRLERVQPSHTVAGRLLGGSHPPDLPALEAADVAEALRYAAETVRERELPIRQPA